MTSFRVCGEAGFQRRLKNALMRACITGWNDVEIQGEVVAKPKKNTRRGGSGILAITNAGLT